MKIPFNGSKKGLNIIVVGCGKVGRTIVERLCGEGHDITVIDSSPDRINEITGSYDVMGVTGNGASHATLVDAGIDKADILIAVTQSDELNILCCIMAKQASECDTIARVRTPDYSREAGYIKDKLGLTLIINPDLATAGEIARLLYLPTALDVNAFAHGQVEMVRFKLPEGNILAGKSIASFEYESIDNILICAVERGDELSIPSGDFVMREGDLVSFVSPMGEARKFLEDIGITTKKIRSTIIVGGSKAAFYLARRLIGMNVDVKIIEEDEKRCEELSKLLPKATIINADGTNRDVLKEEGIEFTDSFMALTGMDEQNIFLTLHARNVSNAKVITKIDHLMFKDVLDPLDLGSIIYPRYLTAEAIVAYVRRKKNTLNSSTIETLYHLFNEKAEAIEFMIERESDVTGRKLSELKLKDSLLICCIVRSGKMIIPSGNDEIKVGDDVMVLTTHTGFDDIDDILVQNRS